MRGVTLTDDGREAAAALPSLSCITCRMPLSALRVETLRGVECGRDAGRGTGDAGTALGIDAGAMGIDAGAAAGLRGSDMEVSSEGCNFI